MTIDTMSAHQVSVLVGHATAIADRAALELLRTEGVCESRADGWYDIRALLSEHEFSAATIDEHRQALGYAFMRGIAAPHPEHRHLVRLLRDE